MVKLSVIIPVYNVENYIERCARSLFEQTLDDIEYLFIDDCTPDRSIDILKHVLEDYPLRRKQVIIHRMEKNSGQAAVRKWGMQNATGEYVIHCDSDDWVDANMYKHMYEKAVVDDADIVVCDFVVSDGNQIKYFNGCNSTNVFELIDDILFQKIHGSLCNKLFRRNRLKKDFLFPKGNVWEDMTIVIQLLLACNKVSYISEPYYNYYNNPKSIVNSQSKEKNIRKFLSKRENLNIIVESLSNKSLIKKYSDNIIDLKFKTLYSLYPYVNHEECYKLLLSSYPQMTITFLSSQHATFRYKILYILALMRIFPLLLKVLKKI